MNDRLDVHLYGVRVGTLDLLGPQSYRLSYLPEWQDDTYGMPVSLSLPLRTRVHTGTKLSSFIDNLLPDNADVRERWAVDAGLPTAEPFHLLRVYGKDVAGAIQFTAPGEPAAGHGSKVMVTDAEVAARIRAIREDDTSWQASAANVGRFSLGGAQGKFSIGNTGDGWYEPTGEHPTTHILKPRVRGQVDGELIEYLVMRAAQRAGMGVADVAIGEFDGEHALVVTRFDRIIDGDTVTRVHQEDLAQSFGVPRLQKYEDRGGPTYEQVLDLLGENAERDIARASKSRFVQALVFSWIVLNTDAHAKNYSVFIEPGNVALTPLYDVSSLLPFLRRPEDDDRRLAERFKRTPLSMRIAADYEAGQMSWFEWKAIARGAGLDVPAFAGWVRSVVDVFPTLMLDAATTLPQRLQTDTVARLLEHAQIRRNQLLRQVTAD